MPFSYWGTLQGKLLCKCSLSFSWCTGPPAPALACPFLSTTQQGDDIHEHFTPLKCKLESPGRDRLHSLCPRNGYPGLQCDSPLEHNQIFSKFSTNKCSAHEVKEYLKPPGNRFMMFRKSTLQASYTASKIQLVSLTNNGSQNQSLQ